jgi:hypothetical protein
MAEAFYQRGANGRIAERECAVTIVRSLKEQGLDCVTDASLLEHARDEAVRQFEHDLSVVQVERALAQGVALGQYVALALIEDPELLGLRSRGINPSNCAIAVIPVGNNTNSGTSADILLAFSEHTSKVRHVAISLKAYRGDASSLGSKGALASLHRLFGRPGIEITQALGEPAIELRALMDDYKRVSKDFYDGSAEGEEFLIAYEARKGTRRVSNPLRRKELGDYFASIRGFKSEHEFARLFVEAYRAGVVSIASDEARAQFYDGMRFLLGMERDVIVLNAIADDTGRIIRITNSLTDSKYGRINNLLDIGCVVELTSRPMSGGISVLLFHGALASRDLRLAMWKDATIQFQLVGPGGRVDA